MWAGDVAGHTRMEGSQDTPPTGQSSKRASREQVVNSPAKNPGGSVEYYMRTREKSRDKEELEECLELLRADGVEEGTELHYIATFLFMEHIRRFTYLRINCRKARIGWIKWTWKNVMGK